MSHAISTAEHDAGSKRSRRLKPGVAAQLHAAVVGAEIRELYARPVEELSPEEIARMRAAFFRG